MAKPKPNAEPSEAKKFLQTSSEEGKNKPDESENKKDDSAGKEDAEAKAKAEADAKAKTEADAKAKAEVKKPEPKKDKYEGVPRKFHKFIK